MAITRLRVDLVFDDEVGTWHYAIPALHAVGGGAGSRADALRMAAEAAAFALEAEDGEGPEAGYLRVEIADEPLSA